MGQETVVSQILLSIGANSGREAGEWLEMSVSDDHGSSLWEDRRNASRRVPIDWHPDKISLQQRIGRFVCQEELEQAE